MRHQVRKYRLNRPKGPRMLLVSNLAASLIRNEYITTTKAKANVLKSYIDKIVVKAKKNDNANRNQINKMLHDKLAIEKLFEDFQKRYKDRISGFTRIAKMGYRKGDNTQMVRIEMISEVKKTKQKKAVKKNENKNSKEK